MIMDPTEARPDKWVVLEFTTDGKTTRNLLSAWFGGYLHGDSWRLSSPLVNESQDGLCWRFETSSGSVYHCHASAEGMSSLSAGIYNQLVEQTGGNATLEVLHYTEEQAAALSEY